MVAVSAGVGTSVGLVVSVGTAVSVGLLTVLVGEICVSVGGFVGIGLVAAGLQAASRKAEIIRMDANLFIGILTIFSLHNPLGNDTKNDIL